MEGRRARNGKDCRGGSEVMEREEEREDIRHTFPRAHRVNRGEKTQKYLQIHEFGSDGGRQAKTYAPLGTSAGGGGRRGDV